MTTLIVVSHSEEIANGIKKLIGQMADGVQVIPVGGSDGTIGTSFEPIQQAIEGLKDDAICFFDLGSAEMNLDMAIEMYEGAYRVEKVEAPIVEGSFLASVNISTGLAFEEVIEAVENEYC
ncbi:dihydroxyacetone kinase phosphoryl donor subunit DhaM [Staphylococcus simulans]|uniref:dihydroxyacetone kinase phosphoryl donor subunit DhaM n=1 Tax=Staphylococcus simulans TaxID=1286 RepID=UPI000D036B2C|nr:dihydroxyacetone kinase phosphoryl donor subunit DhaM [Staphylococcus simulans]MCD8915984.1 PTS-dependent dihydroxyacetone kinase phosphotransferase subunit DhaM [Staphylococcus simulans]